MKIFCQCGIEFGVAKWQIDSGRGKYCSKTCLYKYRTRPSGLKYNIVSDNPGWIKPGIRHSPGTEFRPNTKPWNDGLKYGPCSDKPVGYQTLHNWVRYHKGPAKYNLCKCGNQAVHWANVSHEYLKDLSDFAAMCKTCHIEYDKGHRGASLRSKR